MVSQIADSHYANGIHPTPSHAMLILGQSEVWEWQREVLEIGYDPHRQRFTFTFGEHPNTKPWITFCSNEEGFQGFERCMAARKWFAFQPHCASTRGAGMTRIER